MNLQQKIIKPKIGLLELGKQLGKGLCFSPFEWGSICQLPRCLWRNFKGAGQFSRAPRDQISNDASCSTESRIVIC
jgi:hypothetical protein